MSNPKKYFEYLVAFISSLSKYVKKIEIEMVKKNFSNLISSVII